VTPLRQIMRPLEKVRDVRPDRPVSQATGMAREELNQLPARGSILQVLHSRSLLKGRNACNLFRPRLKQFHGWCIPPALKGHGFQPCR